MEFNEDKNLIIENYLPANFRVTIPKKIILDGNFAYVELMEDILI